MKSEATISHNEALIDELRGDPAFVAEYLRAAAEDSGEPQVLRLALRQVAVAIFNQ